MGNTAKQCRHGLFQDSDFAGDLEDSEINIRWTLVHIRKSHVCANKLDVQATDFSYTQFNRSWNCFSRCRFTHGWNSSFLIFGILSLKVFHSFRTQFNNTKDQVRGNSSRNTTSNEHTQNQTKVPTQHDNLFWVMLIMSRRTRSFLDLVRCSTFFEDNEAVTKMIIKGRSPTMRHVSRTHRVALDWLFDRINLDPKIQIKCVDTKHQLADILTKGNFTRDEWNNLLHLFGISHFSLLCCSQNFSLTSCTKTMAKRMQEQQGEERIVAKSKPTMNLAFTVSTSSSTVQNPIASTKSPEMLKAPCRKDWSNTVKLEAEEHNQDAASSSQGWQKDAVLDVGTRKPAVREEDHEHLNFPEDTISTRKLVASGNSETEGKDKIWPHNLQKSTDCVPHMEKVFSIVRHRCGLSPRDEMKNLDVTAAIWGTFLSVSLRAAVHLGRDFSANLRSTKNQQKKSWRQLFQVTQKLITDQTEITGITTTDWRQRMWRETTLLTDRAVHFATAKKKNLRLFWLSAMSGRYQYWTSQSMGKQDWMFLGNTFFSKKKSGSDRRGTNGTRVENFPGFTTLGILDEIQKTMISELKCEPGHSEGSIIFMSMYNDIGWRKRGHRENCFANAHRVTGYARRFTRGHWSFLGPGSEKTWYGTDVSKLDGESDKTAQDMMLNFAESRHRRSKKAKRN